MTKVAEILEFAKTIDGVDVWECSDRILIEVQDFGGFDSNWNEIVLDYDEEKVEQLIDMLPTEYEGWEGNREYYVDGVRIDLDFASADI